jgi:hypothetical protein
MWYGSWVNYCEKEVLGGSLERLLSCEALAGSLEVQPWGLCLHSTDVTGGGGS